MVAVYVFANARCMELGLTMLSRHFGKLEKAKEYADGLQFALVVEKGGE